MVYDIEILCQQHSGSRKWNWWIDLFLGHQRNDQIYRVRTIRPPNPPILDNFSSKVDQTCKVHRLKARETLSRVQFHIERSNTDSIYSLGWAFRVLAIVSASVNIMCTLLIRDRNKAVGSIQIAFDFRLFKRPEFLLLLGWGFLSMLGYVVLLFSLPNYARSIGLSANQGSIIGALLNVGQGEFIFWIVYG